MTKWIVGSPGGPSGPFYSIVSQMGEVIALQIVDEDRANQIAKLGAILDWDTQTIERAREQLYGIMVRDFGDKPAPIEYGTGDYVIRAVLEALELI